MHKTGLFGAFCGLLITVVMQTFLANAAPVMARDWNIDSTGFGWMFTSYMFAAAVCIPLSGQLVDRWGARKISLSGITLFALATLSITLATNFWVFIAGRLIQGLAAALLGTATLALIADLVPQNKKGRFFGIAGSVQAAGYLLGPPVGGVLIESFGWKIAFSTIGIFAFITCAMLLTIRTKRESKHTNSSLDWAGAIWSAICLFAILMLGKPFLGSANAPALPAILVFIVLAAGYLFYRHEARHPHPLFPQALMRSPDYRFSLIACLFVGVMQYCAVVFIPLVAQNIRNSTVLETVWFSLPMVVGGIVGNVVGGRLGERISVYVINMIGLSFAGTGFLAFAALLTTKYDWALQLASMSIGIGIAFYYPSQLAVAERVGADRIGSALALLNTARNVGGALSISLLTLIMTLNESQSLVEKLRLVFLLLGLSGSVCLLLNFRINRCAQPAPY